MHKAVNHAAFVPLSDGVSLMRASFDDHAFERHSHDGYAIGITTHGVQRFRCKGARHDSVAGDFVLFNPDEDHDGGPGTPDGFRYTIWYVPQSIVSDKRYFARPHVTDPQLAARFGRLSASLIDTPQESLRVASTVRAFLDTLLARHGERAAPSLKAPADAGGASLARVRDYIRAHFARDITVADLALVANMSRAHLTRAFTAAYHTPPHVYLNAVRVAQAQGLIRAGLPLVDVALACGFADQSHLTRRFKGSIGVTPADWRAMTRSA